LRAVTFWDRGVRYKKAGEKTLGRVLGRCEPNRSWREVGIGGKRVRQKKGKSWEQRISFLRGADKWGAGTKRVHKSVKSGETDRETGQVRDWNRRVGLVMVMGERKNRGLESSEMRGIEKGCKRIKCGVVRCGGGRGRTDGGGHRDCALGQGCRGTGSGIVLRRAKTCWQRLKR